MMPWLSGILLCVWELHGLGKRLARRHRSRKSAANLSARDVLDRTARRGLLCRASALWRGIGSAAERMDDGSWVEVGRRISGPYLTVAIALGGALCGLGMFNA